MYGIKPEISKTPEDSMTAPENEDYDSYGYNLGWARSRNFLKQLVKDNIDVSLIEYELSRHTKYKRPKSWRQYFLICLRSHILQIVLSLLVLLDAGIVIGEIVLEIQSLQSYKRNFRTQLKEFQKILCNIMLMSSPDSTPIPQCSEYEFVQYNSSSKSITETHESWMTWNKAQNPLVNSSNRRFLDSYLTDNSNSSLPAQFVHPSYSSHPHSSEGSDGDILNTVCAILTHWQETYQDQIACKLKPNPIEQDSSQVKQSRDIRSDVPYSLLKMLQNTSWIDEKSEFTKLLKNMIEQWNFTLNQSQMPIPNASQFLYMNSFAHTGHNNSTTNAFSFQSNRTRRAFADDTGPNLSSNLTDSRLHPSLLTPHIYISNELCVEIQMDFRPLGAKTMHDASEILHYLSIAITGLFLLCVIFKVICLGRHFFRDTNEYFDGGIIIASFASDILYVRYVSETTAAMVVLLLWRIIRIINALMMHKKQQYEFRIAMQKRSRRVMGRKMEVLRTEKEMQDKHILALENLLRDLGVSSQVIRKCKPSYKQCTKEQTNNALKSIAALTTGFMGGLVGAPSNIQEVISRYSGNAGTNTPTASQSALQQPDGWNTALNGTPRIKSLNQILCQIAPSSRPLISSRIAPINCLDTSKSKSTPTYSGRTLNDDTQIPYVSYRQNMALKSKDSSFEMDLVNRIAHLKNKRTMSLIPHNDYHKSVQPINDQILILKQDSDFQTDSPDCQLKDNQDGARTGNDLEISDSDTYDPVKLHSLTYPKGILCLEHLTFTNIVPSFLRRNFRKSKKPNDRLPRYSDDIENLQELAFYRLGSQTSSTVNEILQCDEELHKLHESKQGSMKSSQSVDKIILTNRRKVQQQQQQQQQANILSSTKSHDRFGTERLDCEDCDEQIWILQPGHQLKISKKTNENLSKTTATSAPECQSSKLVKYSSATSKTQSWLARLNKAHR